MMFKVAQESSTEALKSSEEYIKMKDVDIHRTIEKAMEFEREPEEAQGCTRMHVFDSETCVGKSTAGIIIRICTCR